MRKAIKLSLSINGGNVSNFMAESKKEIDLSKLINGEKVFCPKCKTGYFIPYNSTCYKAHFFECTDCGYSIHWDPVIDLE